MSDSSPERKFNELVHSLLSVNPENTVETIAVVSAVAMIFSYNCKFKFCIKFNYLDSPLPNLRLDNFKYLPTFFP